MSRRWRGGRGIWVDDDDNALWCCSAVYYCGTMSSQMGPANTLRRRALWIYIGSKTTQKCSTHKDFANSVNEINDAVLK